MRSVIAIAAALGAAVVNAYPKSGVCSQDSPYFKEGPFGCECKADGEGLLGASAV